LKEIGEILKKAREEKGLSIDDIQQITKIRSRYLNAIEEGNLDVLPGEVYAKGYIKSYAEAVGLNVREVMALYEEKTAELKGLNLVRDEKRNEPKRKNSEFNFAPVLKVLTVIIILSLLFYGGYFAAGEFYALYKEFHDKPVKEIKKQEVENKNSEPQKPELKVEKKEATSTKATYEITSQKNEITMRLFVSGELSWVRVIADGKTVFEGILNKGKDAIYVFKESATVILGRASDVTVFIEDIPIEKVNIIGRYDYIFERK